MGQGSGVEGTAVSGGERGREGVEVEKRRGRKGKGKKESCRWPFLSFERRRLLVSAAVLLLPRSRCSGCSRLRPSEGAEKKCGAKVAGGRRERDFKTLRNALLRKDAIQSRILSSSHCLPPLHRQRLVVPVLPGPVDIGVGVHARAGLHSEGLRRRLRRGRARRRRT